MGCLFFEVVVGVESGLSTVHFPLEQWIFQAGFFLWRGGGVVSKQRVPRHVYDGQSNWLAAKRRVNLGGT